MKFNKYCSYIHKDKKGKIQSVMVAWQDQEINDLDTQWEHWEKCTKCYGSEKK